MELDWTLPDAKTFALAAHASIGHKRPHSDESYEVHLAEVAALVESVPHTRAMVDAAWLHDVRDDVPGVTQEKLEAKFGRETAAIVDNLSDAGVKGNRATRKAAERRRLAAAPAADQTVKLADIISNTRTIVERNPRFAQVYVPEKAELVKVLGRGDPTLLALARRTVGEAIGKLAKLPAEGGGHA
jgi:(p)ppGpp synthase/HD superfamily hydrolase